jgi:REP element-mobilizing transposase RayT
MARPLRFCAPGLSVHVYCRGNRKEPIFFSDKDRWVFLSKLRETLTKYNFVCHAFCLMPNHYHLYLKMRQPNLSAGIHYLNSSFSNWLKAKHKITGHVFQGRFGSIIVDDSAYALFLSGYIHLNPVRAKICDLPEDFLWSSYNDYFVRRKPLLPEIDRETILHFLHSDIKKALPLYEKYVRDLMHVTDIREFLTQGIALGDEEFIRRVKAEFNLTGNRREHAAALRTDVLPRTMETISRALFSVLGKNAGGVGKEVLQQEGGEKPEADRMMDKMNDTEEQIGFGDAGEGFSLGERNLLIYLAKKYCVLTLADIGGPWMLDYAAVAQIVRRMERRRAADPATQRILLETEKCLGVRS